MPIILAWKRATTLPVEADTLRPDALKGLSAGDASRLRMLVGNEWVEVGDLFEIEGDASDEIIHISGDLRCLKRLGMGMISGSMHIHGDVGEHLGRGMTGGTILVHGSAGDGAGMAMKGGWIHIRGDAGHRLGAAEPGRHIGMRDGVILVHGSIGDDAGSLMRRGLIAVSGTVGVNAGRGMIAGSIFAFGPVGIGLGLGMKRGTLAVFGGNSPPIGPSFAPGGRDCPPFVTIYLKQLRGWEFPVPESAFAGTFSRYNGDRIEGGQGEILVSSAP